MSSQNGVNFEEVGKCHDVQAANKQLRANLSMSSDDPCVGAGMLGVHIDRMLQRMAQLEDKKKHSDKNFEAMLAQIEGRLNSMRAESARLGEELSALEDEMGGLDKMAEKAGVKFDGTETDAEKKQKIPSPRTRRRTLERDSPPCGRRGETRHGPGDFTLRDVDPYPR